MENLRKFVAVDGGLPRPFGQRLARASFLGMVVLPFG
jgi:hypothetical protein